MRGAIRPVSESYRFGIVMRRPLELDVLVELWGRVTCDGSLYDGVRSTPPGVTCALGGSGMTG